MKTSEASRSRKRFVFIRVHSWLKLFHLISIASGDRSNATCDDETARDDACRFGVSAPREAGLFAPYADREFARLDDAFAFVVNDRHPLGAEREGDGLLLARLEKDSLDPCQRSDRSRDSSGHVGHIQLNDFIAGAVAGVAHVRADLDALACPH